MESFREKRATIKQSLTQFSNYLGAVKQNLDKIDLSAKLVIFEPLLEKYEEIQGEIEVLAENANEIAAEEKEHKDFEDEYYAALVSARRLLMSAGQRQPDPPQRQGVRIPAARYEPPKGKTVADQPNENVNSEDTQNMFAARSEACAMSAREYVLLATARVKVLNSNEKARKYSALPDQGSQVHPMTAALRDKLGIELKEEAVEVTGIDGSRTVKNCTKAKLDSRVNNYNTSISCLVRDKIGDEMPSREINYANIEIPRGVQLANTRFKRTGPVDLLIGAGLWYKLECASVIRPKEKQLLFKETLLGWIAVGKTQHPGRLTPRVTCNLLKTEQLRCLPEVDNYYIANKNKSKVPNASSGLEQGAVTQASLSRENNEKTKERADAQHPKDFGHVSSLTESRFARQARSITKNKNKKKGKAEPLPSTEQKCATKRVAGHVHEISAFGRDAPLPKTSRLLRPSTYLGDQGLFGDGSQLKDVCFPYEQNCSLTKSTKYAIRDKRDKIDKCVAQCSTVGGAARRKNYALQVVRGSIKGQRRKFCRRRGDGRDASNFREDFRRDRAGRSLLKILSCVSFVDRSSRPISFDPGPPPSETCYNKRTYTSQKNYAKSYVKSYAKTTRKINGEKTGKEASNKANEQGTARKISTLREFIRVTILRKNKKEKWTTNLSIIEF